MVIILIIVIVVVIIVSVIVIVIIVIIVIIVVGRVHAASALGVASAVICYRSSMLWYVIELYML